MKLGEKWKQKEVPYNGNNTQKGEEDGQCLY